MFLLVLIVLTLFLARLLQFGPIYIIITGMIAVPVISAIQLEQVILSKDQIKDGF